MGQVQREPSVPGWLGDLDERLANLERLSIGLEMQRGVVEITWPGASTKSNVLTIPVVGGAALRPFLTPWKSAVGSYIPVVESLTETELKVFGFCAEGAPGATKSKLSWWLA